MLFIAPSTPLSSNGTVPVEPLNKGHFGANIISFFVGRLSSSRRFIILVYKECPLQRGSDGPLSEVLLFIQISVI